MDRASELEYILKFVKEANFNSYNVCAEQLRGLWTAYCLHHNLDVDTAEYDRDIWEIWDTMKAENDSHVFWNGFADFDFNMCGHLI